MYKGLPFKTVWLEYPEIEPTMKKLGAEPSARKKPDGSPVYTVPVIHDTTTGKVVTDSFKIAEYLDDTYPEKPALFPLGARAPVHMYHEFVGSLLEPIFPLLILPMCSKLSPTSDEYYHQLWKYLMGGVSVEEFYPPPGPKRDAAWAQIKANFSKIAAVVQKNGAGKGPYFYGDTFSHADTLVVAFLHWMRAILGQEPEWADFDKWDGGLWARLMEQTKEYQKGE